MKTILVVCTANICRSPMAAALLRQRLAALGLSQEVEVKSAGVFAREGDEASHGAAQVLAERNVAIGPHRSQPVSIQLLQEASMVLVMEESHRRSIFYLAPAAMPKVFLLAEMSGRHDDVPDPYGGPIEEYEETADLLEQMIDAGMPGILKRLKLTPKES